MNLVRGWVNLVSNSMNLVRGWYNFVHESASYQIHASFVTSLVPNSLNFMRELPSLVSNSFDLRQIHWHHTKFIGLGPNSYHSRQIHVKLAQFIILGQKHVTLRKNKTYHGNHLSSPKSMKEAHVHVMRHPYCAL